MKPGSLIFVSAPLGADDDGRPARIRAALDAAEVLARVGLLPFVPHLWHHWDKAHPAPYETWIRRCLAMLTGCDVLLRLDGESPGADRETAAALAIGMPVYRSITALILDVGVELPAREPHWCPPPEQCTRAFVAAFNALEPPAAPVAKRGSSNVIEF